VAAAGESGVGVPRHPGGACGHRHGHDPFGPGQAVERLPEQLPLAAVSFGEAGPGADLLGGLGFRDIGAVVHRLFNVLNWYPFGRDFVSVHYRLAYVVVGSVLLHVAVKLPDIVYGLQTKIAEGDVLTEVPWNEKIGR